MSKTENKCFYKKPRASRKTNFERITKDAKTLARVLSCLCIEAEMQNPIPKKTKYTVEFFENWLRSTRGKAEDCQGE